MNGEYLLDTNIVIAGMRGEPGIADHIASAAAVYVSIIAVGELVYGAFKDNRTASDLARIYIFIADANVLNCDTAVAETYGVIKAAQHRQGRPLPENDLCIAATARHHNLTLVSRDAHFRHIEGLAVTTW